MKLDNYSCVQEDNYSFAQSRYIAERAVEYLACLYDEFGCAFTEEVCKKAVPWAFFKAKGDFEAAGWNLRLVPPVELFPSVESLRKADNNLSTCQKIRLF